VSNQQYPILWRGQTSGPYTVDQIQQMLDNRQLSLSHQVNDGQQWVFVEDFLIQKQAEQQKIKADIDTQVAESKAQLEHQRAMQLEAAKASAAAHSSNIMGAPPIVGGPHQVQGGPPVMAGQPPFAAPHLIPQPMNPRTKKSSNTALYIILALVILASLGAAGYAVATKYLWVADKLVGTWQGTEDASNDTLNFKSDGTFLFESNDKNHGGSWKVSDGLLLLRSDSWFGEGKVGTCSYTITGSRLELRIGDESFTLIKK